MVQKKYLLGPRFKLVPNIDHKDCTIYPDTVLSNKCGSEKEIK